MKRLLLITAALLALTSAANAVELPDELLGQWCEVPKRAKYDNRVLVERSNGWYVKRLQKISEDDCQSQDGFIFEISKDHFGGCTPLSISKGWVAKARCGGDPPSTFRATVKFSLKSDHELVTYWKD